MAKNQFQSMLKATSRRLALASFARTYFFCALITLVIYLIAMLATRLTGIVSAEVWAWPLELKLMGWILIPTTAPLTLLIAGIPAIAFYKRPTLENAAVVVDGYAETDDLFLTSLRLDSAAGDYGPLVTERAEKRAHDVSVRAATPYHPWKRVAFVSLLFVITGLATAMMPGFDVLGRQQERQAAEAREERLAEMRERTTKRKEELVVNRSKSDDELEKNLAELRADLRKLDPNRPRENREILRRQSEKLRKQWTQRRSEALKNRTLNNRFSAQSREMKKMAEDLNRGDTRSFDKAMQAMKQQAEQFKNAQTDEERQKIKEDMQRKLQEMADMSRQEAGGERIAEALERAKDQIGQSDDNNMDQAAQDAKESMELAQNEAENVAKVNQDTQRIKDAMEAVQNAQQANNNGNMNKEGIENAANQGNTQDMKDAMKKMAEGQQQGGDTTPQDGQTPQEGSGQNTDPSQQGNGTKQANGEQPARGNGGTEEGEGFPSEGTGRSETPGDEGGNPGGDGHRPDGTSGTVAENDDAETQFKNEKVEGHLQAGRSLIDRRVRGEARAGEAQEDYAESIRELQDGVEDAILAEEIPAGYHGPIKQYFDNLSNED